MKRIQFLAVMMIIVCSFSLSADKGTIVRVGGDVVIEEEREVEDVVAIGGDIEVYGDVDGEAVAVGGSITIFSNGYIDGNAVSVGGHIHTEEGGIINGDLVEVQDLVSTFIPLNWDDWGGFYWAFRLFSFIGFIALAMVLILFLPKQITVVSDSVEVKPLRAILFGILGVVLIVPVIISLVLSVIGIILIPLFCLIIILAILFGYLAVGRLVGKRLFMALDNADRPILLEGLVGLVLLGLIGMIPVVGWFVKLLVYLIGFGGVIDTIVSKKKSLKISIKE